MADRTCHRCGGDRAGIEMLEAAKARLDEVVGMLRERFDGDSWVDPDGRTGLCLLQDLSHARWHLRAVLRHEAASGPGGQRVQ